MIHVRGVWFSDVPGHYWWLQEHASSEGPSFVDEELSCKNRMLVTESQELQNAQPIPKCTQILPSLRQQLFDHVDALVTINFNN